MLKDFELLNLNVGYHVETPCIDGSIILKCLVKE